MIHVHCLETKRVLLWLLPTPCFYQSLRMDGFEPPTPAILRLLPSFSYASGKDYYITDFLLAKEEKRIKILTCDGLAAYKYCPTNH